MDLVVGKNSYMTIEEADEIIDDVFFDDEEESQLWVNLSESEKSKLIYRGTKIIETLPFLGIQFPGYGNMKWPRLIQYRYVECPYDVKVAILKQALKNKVDSGKEETRLQKLGVKTYSIKNASISFGETSLNGRLQNGIYEAIYEEHLVKWVY